MKKRKLFLPVVLMILALAGCQKDDEQLQVQDDSSTLKSASVSNKYIVVLNDDAVLAKSDFQTRNGKVTEKAYGLLKKYAITGAIEEVYETALQGFTVKMAPGQAKKLAFDSNVKIVEADQVISLSPISVTGKPAPVPPAEIIPLGITRVGGGISGIGKTAWIIDTGIDLNHPDLTVNVTKSRTFLTGKSTPDDQNGHGTHVAGTIAAKNNDIGVIGVAAGATVISVRVLDRNGSGYTSGVIAGVNYVAANGQTGDVANMSLGGGVSSTLDQAVLTASGKGVKFSLAAGNESDDANNHSPARVDGPNIYTVSAMDSNDNWAYFSNYGSHVDYCAPGVYIYSTYKDGGYATLSGTSMAAPHVAGVLLLGAIHTSGYVQNDPDGNPDPIAHH